MKLSKALFAAATFVLAANASADATVSQMNGGVLYHNGDSYQAAQPGMNLKTGSRVMLMEGAEVVLTYDDGCIARHNKGEVLQVGTGRACESGKNAAPALVGGIPVMGLVAGAAVIGLGVYVATQANDASNN